MARVIVTLYEVGGDRHIWSEYTYEVNPDRVPPSPNDALAMAIHTLWGDFDPEEPGEYEHLGRVPPLEGH